MHPAILPLELLQKECSIERTRRGGPGGQNRNKVETAILITHLPTGVHSEANERRTQIENRRVAWIRLRLELAKHVRTPTPEADWATTWTPSPCWKKHLVQDRLLISKESDDLPSILAELLDVLSWCNDDLKKCSDVIGISASQIMKVLRIFPTVLAMINQRRMASHLHLLH